MREKELMFPLSLVAWRKPWEERQETRMKNTEPEKALGKKGEYVYL